SHQKWNRSFMSHQTKNITLNNSNRGVVCVAHSSGALSDSVQYWLNIRGRASDDSQNFTRRSLLFQRLLQLLEQSNILDGDHRLISESFEKLDLRRGKGTHLGATPGQCSNMFSLLTKGNNQEGAEPCQDTQHWKIVLREDVRNVERAMLANPTNLGLIDIYLDATNRYGTKMSPWNRSVSFIESQQHVINPTSPGGALNDRIEDRLHVSGRAADNAQHLGCCGLMLQRFAQFGVAFLDLLEQPNVLDSNHGL